jgi:glycosyltransferase involved in cell wall biosynthesis
VTDLAVIETHPVQYHAPVYRELQAEFGVNVTCIYASDFSIAGYRDDEFGTTFAWETDLLSGYSQHFLSRVADGGARNATATTAVGLEEVLAQVQPRAILVTGYHPRFYRQAFRIALRQNVPVLFRAETTDHARARGMVKGFVRDNALRYVYRQCEALLYVGERSRAHYARLGIDADRLVFSPYCVDDRPFRTSEASRAELRGETREELNIQDNDFVILFAGKLVSRKDPLRIVEAARMLNEGPRPVIVYLGAGSMQEEIETAASIDPPVQVRFIGFQNQLGLSAYYHASDCLVLPSVHDETWGLVVNEALIHGVPAVVSDAVGCAPDLIEDSATGAVFEAGNADALALALRRVYPLINNAAARERCRAIVNAYSVNNAARGIAAAFQRAAANG